MVKPEIDMDGVPIVWKTGRPGTPGAIGGDGVPHSYKSKTACIHEAPSLVRAAKSAEVIAGAILPEDDYLVTHDGRCHYAYCPRPGNKLQLNEKRVLCKGLSPQGIWFLHTFHEHCWDTIRERHL